MSIMSHCQRDIFDSDIKMQFYKQIQVSFVIIIYIAFESLLFFNILFYYYATRKDTYLTVKYNIRILLGNNSFNGAGNG